VRAGNAVGRVAATVLDRTERRTKSGSKMGIVMLSDQTGHFEAIVFSEGLQRLRDILEPGRAVSLVLQAGLEGEDVRARIQMAEPLEEAVAKYQKGMRIFLRDGGEREVEVKLPGRYMATPQIAGALRAVPGVVDVQIN
jgi:DNA polymerase III subunit alpha